MEREAGFDPVNSETFADDRVRHRIACRELDDSLVAHAEARSISNAVTILTSDRIDVQLLVDLTGATNIGVQVV